LFCDGVRNTGSNDEHGDRDRNIVACGDKPRANHCNQSDRSNANPDQHTASHKHADARTFSDTSTDRFRTAAIVYGSRQMTLLFFLRSPAGNTDAVSAPDAGVYQPAREPPKKRDRQERLAERKAKRKRDKAVAAALLADQRRRKKRKDEELLMMLFMHEFDGYDD
jgi:hypothetical protein